MRWQVRESQTDEQWFEEYVTTVLSSRPATLPPTSQRIGHTEATWFETEPGVAFISTMGGSPDDRVLAESVVRNQLAGHGIKQAEYSIEPIKKTADFTDIMAKAKRLVQTGAVQIKRNSRNDVVAMVSGDHVDEHNGGRPYEVTISRQDPESMVITQWTCECPWNQYAFQRTRKWKKYEGRSCAHVLAALWKSYSTPLDEDIHPATQQGQQMGLFDMPAQGTGLNPSPFRAPAPAPQGVQPMLPGMMPGQATGTPPMPGQTMPPDPGVIPPFPMAPDPNAVPVNPASVPGLRQPSPTNPVQYPGGTFSSVSDDWEFGHNGFESATIVSVQQPEGFVNGNMVSTNEDDWGTLIGRSEEHGSGQQIKVPKGSIGEVLGQDPTTGMVNVLFENKMTENMGPLEPNGVVAWFFPSELRMRPDVRRPGPAVRRK